jgi:hypothetical protein
MFFFFVCGEHTFRKDVHGYEGMVCQCYNCGNMAGRVIKSHPWFTFCWIVSSFLLYSSCRLVRVRRCIDIPFSLRRRHSRVALAIALDRRLSSGLTSWAMMANYIPVHF